MSNIINLADRKLDPHGSGEAHCMLCAHTWVAVAPVGTVWLECPECKANKGTFSFAYEPATSWQCDCGNKLFYITPDNYMCANCGTRQEFGG